MATITRSLARRLLVVLLMVAALAGCRRERRSLATDEERPPLVLISIDTLRSDHLPIYGYRGVATPAIDGLRRDGILFERAYSAAPLTAPSHATLFSGQPPTLHGLRDNVGYRYESQRLPHLPGLLKGLGYRTAGAVSAFVLRGELGFAAGFDLYDDRIQTRMGRGLSGLQRAGTETLAAVEGWLAEAARTGSFFLFLHLYEPHAPYHPPSPWAERYAQRYDGEIAAADAVVGELVAGLRRLGVYDRAAIVLLSDHGEGLGDHGEHGHGVFLYRHDLQVPLVVKLPRGFKAGAAVSKVVGLGDVHPTLLELAGAPLDPDARAASLLGVLDDTLTDHDLYAETYTPRLHFGWSELRSFIRGPQHYIHGPDPELYDLSRDPGELENLVSIDRRAAAALRSEIETRRVDLAPPVAEDESTRRELAALGYIGAAAVPAGAALPDPKSKVHTLKPLHEGLELFAEERPEEAARALRRAVDANPFMVDAWSYLGFSYQRLRQPEQALSAFKEATKLSGGLPEVALASSTTLFELDRLDEARLVLRHQMARSPEDLRLRYQDVRLLVVAGRVDEAAAAAERTLELPGAARQADAHYLLGTVRMAQRRLTEAETLLRRALEVDATHAAALSDLAVLLAATGRRSEAEAMLERLVDLRPGDAVARANLERIRGRGDR